MRKLYEEFFAIRDGEKIRDKVLFARIAAYITVVIILMAAMSFAAFGYFTSDVETGANRIAAARYTLDIQVMDGNENVYAPGTFTLEAGEYEVRLSYVDGSSSTGFCILKVGDQVFHTLQIGEDALAENGFRREVSFTLKVKEDMPVSLIPSWGTSVYYGDTHPCYIQGDSWLVG